MYYRLNSDADKLRNPLIDILQAALSDSPEILVAIERLEKFRRDHLTKSA